MAQKHFRDCSVLVLLLVLVSLCSVHANVLHQRSLTQYEPHHRHAGVTQQRAKITRSNAVGSSKLHVPDDVQLVPRSVDSAAIEKDLDALQHDIPKLKGEFFNFLNSFGNLLHKLKSLLPFSPASSSVSTAGEKNPHRLPNHKVKTVTLLSTTYKGAAPPKTPLGRERAHQTVDTCSDAEKSSHHHVTKTTTVLSTSATIHVHTRRLTTSTAVLATSSDRRKHSSKTTRHKKYSHTSDKPHTAPASTGTSTAFNAQATNNIIVYYGQTPVTTANGLLTLCQQPAISVINLAFLNVFFGDNGWPESAFGPACTTPDPNSYMAATAPGLQNCSALGPQIIKCQQVYGKKIMVSLGGAIADSILPSASQAVQFAHTMWNLFGAGTGADNPNSTTKHQNKQLRPFGPKAIVDGFDIDNENYYTNYWYDFATTLRDLYVSKQGLATGKTYYLSAAPQCPRPDLSIPEDVMHICDFVNVQFYNNPPCNANTGANGFLASVVAWAQDLNNSTATSSASTSLEASGSGASATTSGSASATASTSSTLEKRRPAKRPHQFHPGSGFRRAGITPKLFIGMPAWSGGAGSGYVPGPGLRAVMRGARKSLKQAGLSNALGGIMLWDGSEAVANVNSTNDKDFIDYVAAALK